MRPMPAGCRGGAASLSEADISVVGLASLYEGISLLQVMPEPDFRKAVHEALQANPVGEAAARITRICKRRGVPFEYDEADGFRWTGDEEIEARVLRPALAALGDPRFAGAVREHFEAARAELHLGTPRALSQSVVEACCAVESAMKTLLGRHEVSFGPNQGAHRLFGCLRESDIVPGYMENVVLAITTPRNKAAHGAAAVAQPVSIETAEAILSSAAISIAYLFKRMPAGDGVGTGTQSPQADCGGAG